MSLRALSDLLQPIDDVLKVLFYAHMFAGKKCLFDYLDDVGLVNVRVVINLNRARCFAFKAVLLK